MGITTSNNYTVAVSKGENPRESILNGLKLLGGISQFINEGDQVFIKFNLNLPSGFPSNTNMETIDAIIQSCNDAGASKVFMGGYPLKNFSVKTISDLLGLKNYFEDLGAELIFLDNSNRLLQKGLKKEQIKAFKDLTLSKVKSNDKEFRFPKIILDSDKVISVNQVNVEPLFHFNSSLTNSYSMVPNGEQEIKLSNEDTENPSLDLYKKKLISEILDVYSIKKPNLVINDAFYILEGAGPYIYKDSNLIKTGLAFLGNNALAVDLITHQLLNLDLSSNNLFLEALKRKIGPSNLSEIEVIGVKANNLKQDINLCPSKLEEINLRKFSINSGETCSGCYTQAYHLLNLIKTNMIKDLKYISPNIFLLGKNPPAEENFETANYIIYGNCAINTSKNQEFRKKKKKINQLKIKIYSN